MNYETIPEKVKELARENGYLKAENAYLKDRLVEQEKEIKDKAKELADAAQRVIEEWNADEQDESIWDDLINDLEDALSSKKFKSL